VIAPDLRGFGDSDRPAGVDAYGIPLSVQDMVMLLDRLEVQRAHVVCHDFGAAVGWALAATQPTRVERFAALSVGHLNAIRQGGFDQRAMSWYMLLFQFEGLAEELLQQGDWAFLKGWGGHHAEAAQWIGDLARPGALTAALNWYRANQHPKRWLQPPVLLPTVAAPTLSMWSSGDVYLNEAQVVRTREFVSGPWRYERIEGASHWMQLDRPETVNRLLVDFLGQAR
jgi:pimeloyl-ACP methyl ester carboxylesterase